VKEYVAENSDIAEIRFVLFSDYDYKVYEEILKKLKD
jgi:hypothetical protein